MSMPAVVVAVAAVLSVAVVAVVVVVVVVLVVLVEVKGIVLLKSSIVCMPVIVVMHHLKQRQTM